MKLSLNLILVTLVVAQGAVIASCPNQCQLATSSTHLHAARELFNAAVRHSLSGLANCYNEYSRLADLDSAFVFASASNTNVKASGSSLPRKSGEAKRSSILSEAALYDDCKTSIEFLLGQMDQLLCGADDILKQLGCCHPLDLACCEVGLIEYPAIVQEYSEAVELLSRKYEQCRKCPKLAVAEQAPSSTWSWFAQEQEAVEKDAICPAEERIDGGRVYNSAAAEALTISRAQGFAALDLAKDASCCSLLTAHKDIMLETSEVSAIFVGRITEILTFPIKSGFTMEAEDTPCEPECHQPEYNDCPVDGCAQRLANIFESAEITLASVALTLNDLSAATDGAQCDWDLKEIAASPQDIRRARTSSLYAIDACVHCIPKP